MPRHLLKLPAKITSGNKKGEQAYVQISNSELGFVKGKDDNGKEFDNTIKIEQDKFEFPQFGPEPVLDGEGKQTNIVTEDEARAGIDEFIADAGSAVAALEIINKTTRDAATFEGKTYIRTAEDGELDAIVSTGLNKSKNFSWKTVEKTSKKEILEGVAALQANMSTMSKEEIADYMAKLLGQV